MKTMIQKIAIILLLCAFPGLVSSQTIITTASTVTTCPGIITIPVNVTNCNGVAAISLTLNYNGIILTFLDYQNVNSALTGGLLSVNAVSNKVIMSWASTTVANAGDGMLIQFRFTAVPGVSSLSWDTQTPGSCEYANLSGTTLPAGFVNGNATINQSPAITLHPVNKSTWKGGSTSFTVSATGTTITYLWQVSSDGGNSWADLSNGGSYSTVTTVTLNISNSQLSMNGNRYRCKVSGACLPIAYSNPALLTVTPLIITACPTFTTCPGVIIVPVSVTDFIGVGAFSMALALNPGVLTYSSYQNLNSALSTGLFSINAVGGNIYISWAGIPPVTLTSGSVLFELKINAIPGTGTLTWDIVTPGNCEYSDDLGQKIFSNWTNGTLTVNQPPLITIQPINKTVYSGGNTTFSVTATGTGLSYRWQVSIDGGGAWTDLSNGAPYSGVTSVTLTVNPAVVSMNGYFYRCKVSGTCTPISYSVSALLTVTPVPIATSISNIVNSCTGNLVIPVNVTNCNNVGGISLTLIFDPVKMTFDGYQSVNSQLGTGLFLVNQAGNKIFLSWASTTPVNIGTGTLLQYRFKANAGISSTLTWDNLTPGNCEYTSVTGTNITSNYTNSTVSVISNALMINAGNDVNITPGNSVQLSGSATGGVSPYTFSWSPGTWLSNPAIANPVATPPQSVTYTLTVTGNNGCIGTDLVNVAIVYNPPTVITSAISNITINAAIGGGNVTSDGGATVTARGVCWNTSPSPTITDFHTVDGTGTGSYSSALTGLNASTLYHVRAYASNTVGTAYGNELSFTTGSPIIPCPGVSTVTYGGKIYNTVKIGTQCWLKENLNIGTRINDTLTQTDNSIIEKYCYNNLESNCDVYGGLYQWNEMMNYTTSSISNPSNRQGVCPAGWHIPSDAEFCQLEAYLDTTASCTATGWSGTDAGGKMKEAGYSHWSSPNTGATNSSGFTALPGGYSTGWFSFEDLNVWAVISSATESSSTDFWNTGMNNNFAQVRRITDSKTWGFSARCLKDTCTTYSNAGVTIGASANPVVQGTMVIFTATPFNEGTTPVYQWKVNGTNTGTNSPTYSYVPINNDIITCVLTSDLPCVSGNPATSNAITMTVNNPPVANAGPNQTVYSGTLVTLDGSASTDINGDSLSFHWSAPQGITLSDSTAILPTFIPPVFCITKTYNFILTVNDGMYNSTPDNVIITATAAPPDISVYPSNLTDTLVSGSTSIKGLKVKNTGSCNLTFMLSSPASWLVILPNFGTVNPGDSVNMDVHFNAANLNTGIYNSEITINTNDPDESTVHIPVILTINGDPLMVLSDSIMNWGIVFTGQTPVKTLIILNTGTDSLHIYSISSSRPEYNANVSNCVIPPQGSKSVAVTFSPATGGQINGFLAISSDNPGQSMDTVQFIGQGLFPPVISVIPTGFNETLPQNQSAVQHLTIHNTGASNLIFNTTENASWLSLSPVSGIIGSGNSLQIDVTFSTALLSPGNYSSNFGISSNDPVTPSVIVDAALNIIQPMNVQANATPSEICMGSSVQLHAVVSGGSGTYSFLWTSEPAGFSSMLQNPAVSPTVATTYNVSISDGYSNAFASCVVTVYENQIPSTVYNMIPVDNSYNLAFPVQFSWASSINASNYDLFIWPYDEPRPSNPYVANLTQINYLYNGGVFSYGDTCKWQLIAKNPCFSTQGPVQIFSLHGLPELHVTGITNSLPLTDQPMTVSWTVKNDGEFETPPGTVWYDRVWLSPDLDVRIAEPEDILLGQFQNVSNLEPGESYIQTQLIQIPANIMGNYFMFIMTDALDALAINWLPGGPQLPYNPPPYLTAFTHSGNYINTVQEISDNPPWHDNFFYKEIPFEIPPLPDLIVNSIITPLATFSGQPLNITWTVKNIGNGNTNTTDWSDRVYFSADSVFDVSSAVDLGTFSHAGILNPDSSYTQTKSVNTPPYIFGKYYFYIQTNANNVVFEHVFEGNNISRSDTVHVVLTPPPDLVVTNISIPGSVSTSDDLNVNWTVQNQGASTPTANNWQDGIYLSASPDYNLTGAWFLGAKSQNVPPMPDSSYASAKTTSIPGNLTWAYYVYVSTDINNNVFEYLNENNNLRRSDTTIQLIHPDLVVTSVTIPSISANSQPFNVQWSVKNNGSGKITNKNWTDKIYISRHTVYHADSVMEITSLNYTATLLPGASLSKQKMISLPDNISGEWYIYIYTDRQNSVFENLHEDNNTIRSTNKIQILKPDLVVENVTIPTVDSTGQLINISWKIKNSGLGTILNRSWTDRIMLSYSPVFNPNIVVEIGTLNYSGTLYPGDSLMKQNSVQLPESVPGPYYIFVQADCWNVIYENGSETNNICRSESMIQVLRPDLIVARIVIPPSAASGDSLQVEWVTKNSGPVSILNKGWTDRVFLSTSLVYNPATATMLGDKVITGSLMSGDSLTNHLTVDIPEGLAGSYYILVYTDYSHTIPENIYENNNVTSIPLSLQILSWADLQVINIQVTNSSMAGTNIPLDFTVENTGTKGIYFKSWTDKVYLSSNPVWNVSTATFLREFQQSVSLDTTESYSVQSSINLPSGLTTGQYFMYVMTDAGNTIFEHTGENNNILRSNPVYISEIPPVDLAVVHAENPDSTDSGQPVYIEWTVENNGDSPTVNEWYDAAYLSADSIWNYTSDLFFGKRKHYGQINPGGSYSSGQSFMVPNGISGNYYFLVIADYEQVNNDDSLFNNYKSRTNLVNVMQPTHISLTPPPDLSIISVVAPLQATTGTPINISWIVKNEGIGPAPDITWTDKVFLSTDFIVGPGDILLGTKTRSGGLTVNQTYSDTIQIILPNTLSGNYILLVKTDMTNVVYESNEINNTKSSFIVLSQPPPADLVVSQIVHPDFVLVGESATIHWDLKNTGLNPGNGTVRDLVYISSDTIWDLNDVLFGSYQSHINLNPGETTTRTVTADVNDIGVGTWYVIVKTDVLNTIYETNEDNNSTFSSDPFTADVTQLPLNTLTAATLNDYENLYFRIEIADSLNNKTMFTTLKGDSIYGSNEMYLKHDEMATRIKYDYRHGNPYIGNQEIYVPAVTEGNYYMLLYGNTTAGNSQEINVKAEILEFELNSVEATSAGNTGHVTLLMRGSKFDSGMNFQLVKGTAIHAEKTVYVDRTKVYATFNLKGAVPGIYDVVADNFCVDRDTLFQAFEVINGLAAELGLHVIPPPNVRANRVTSFMIEYTNLGNVDMISPQIKVKSEGGAPIALTMEALPQNQQELIIPLVEKNGPPGIIRPGFIGTLIVYTKSTGPLGFTIVMLNQ